MISLAIAALLAHACSAAQLNFIDSAQQPFMRTDAASKALSGPGATAVFGALLGASVPMHQTVSNQVTFVTTCYGVIAPAHAPACMTLLRVPVTMTPRLTP